MTKSPTADQLPPPGPSNRIQREPSVLPQDDVRWLALLVRQGLLLICKGIEKKYEIGEAKERRAA